jgi:nucleotide-binding universal stress UspA family protein
VTGFRRVVVGFDGTEPAGDALALAQRLVERDGELLLSLVDAQRSFRLPHGRRPAPPADLVASARELIGDAVAVREVRRSTASAARGLTEIAEAEHADLVVLGAHHGTPEQRTTPGPTALRLFQGSPCAVAIAPRGQREIDRFHHVGVAYDGSPEADAALSAAYAVAARDHAAVSILMVTPAGGVAYPNLGAGERETLMLQLRNQAQEQLDAAAEAAPPGVNPLAVMLHGEPADEIARAADGVVDLLFTGSRGYGPVQRVLAGSVAEALLLSATHPVVVLPRASLASAAPAP